MVSPGACTESTSMQVSPLKPMVSGSPVYDDLEVLAGLADVGIARRQLERAPARARSFTPCDRSLASSDDAPQGGQEIVAVRAWACTLGAAGDHLLVVGELALDQPHEERHRRRLHAHVLLGDDERQLALAASPRAASGPRPDPCAGMITPRGSSASADRSVDQRQAMTVGRRPCGASPVSAVST